MFIPKAVVAFTTRKAATGVACEKAHTLAKTIIIVKINFFVLIVSDINGYCIAIM